jgi:hypothetical protein
MTRQRGEGKEVLGALKSCPAPVYPRCGPRRRANELHPRVAIGEAALVAFRPERARALVS